jgi:hypothetical protein
MSDVVCVQIPTGAKMGRPGLTDGQKERLAKELGGIAPKTEAFRRKRRELAIIFERTERAIELALIAIQSTAEKEEAPVPQENAGQ